MTLVANLMLAFGAVLIVSALEDTSLAQTFTGILRGRAPSVVEHSGTANLSPAGASATPRQGMSL